MLENCKRILLCNGAHLGDLILATSILPVIKEAVPDVKIGFLIGSWALPVLKNHVDVEWIHIFDNPRLNRSSQSPEEKKKQGNKTWHRAIQEIQRISYDLAIDLYYFYRANSGTLLAKAEVPERVGFWASPTHYAFTKRVFWDHSQLHMVENHGRMLKALGVSDHALRLLKPYLNYSEEVQPFQLADQFAKDYVLIHVGAGDPRRQWNTYAWQELAKKIESLGYPLILIGKGKKEKELIGAIQQTLLQPALDLCDQVEWKQLIPLIKNAKLLVGLESMGGHIAAVTDTPGVLIYGRKANVPCWRPYNAGCHVITAPPTNQPINKGKKFRFAAIHRIQPEAVFEVISTLIPKKRSLNLS